MTTCFVIIFFDLNHTTHPPPTMPPKYARKNANTVFCKGIANNGEKCQKYNGLNDAGFCKLHIYMGEYTAEMLANLTPCSGCKKRVYMPNRSICGPCLDRNKQVRKNNAAKLGNCQKDGCKFKCLPDNNYCGKHDNLCNFYDSVEDGLVACLNAERGCRQTFAADSGFVRCESCRVECRVTDDARRENRKQLAEEFDGDSDEKMCIKCGKICELSDFIGYLDKIRKCCKTCRDRDAAQNALRDLDHKREMGRIYDANPVRIEKKAEWGKLNRDKVAERWMNYRKRQLETNRDLYLENNAKVMKAWRDKNPDKVRLIKIKKSENISYSFHTYRVNADDKQLNIDELLTNSDVFIELIKMPCYYCGIVQEKGFNGIDRKSCHEGYIQSNCVSCCEMCNFIKGTLDPVTFYERIGHILTFQKLINWEMNCPEHFADHNNVLYCKYKYRANKKNLEFSISKDDFDNLTRQNCYICNKPKTDSHSNGIDRYDNTKGYVESNVMPCCGECNYMKSNLDYNAFIDKLLKIFNFIEPHDDQYYNENENITRCINSLLGNYLNKMTKDDKQLRAKNNREKRDEIRAEKYSDENIKIRAKELAEHYGKNNWMKEAAKAVIPPVYTGEIVIDDCDDDDDNDDDHLEKKCDDGDVKTTNNDVYVMYEAFDDERYEDDDERYDDIV